MNHHILILLAVLLLLGCSKPEQELSHGAVEKKLQDLLKAAECDTMMSSERIATNNKAFQLVRNFENDSIKTKYLFKIANRYFNESAYDDYKSTCDYILDNVLLLKDSVAIAKAYEYYGDYYSANKIRKDSAFYYYGKAEHLYKIHNNKEKLALISYNKSILLFNGDDFYGAEIAALKALDYFKNTSNYRNIFDGYIILGLVALELEDFNASLRYFDIAIFIIEQHLLDDPESLKSITFNNIAVAHLQAGNPKKAKEVLIVALEDSTLVSKNPRLYSILLDNLAFSKSQIDDDPSEILILYSQSLDIKKQLIDTSNFLFTKTRLADYLLQLRDSTGAIKLAKEVLKTSSKRHDTVNSNKALKVLMLADVKNSSVYAKPYLVNSDILLKSERKAKNKFARFKFDTDQIISERENAIKQKWIVLGISVMIILVIILLYMIKVQHAKHNELKLLQAQQTTNEEIYTLILKQQDQVDAGRVKEKKRIARDLHDGVMNKLASTRLNLDILNTRSDLDTITQCLPYISGIQDIEKEIRIIAHDLNSDIYTKKNGFKSLITNLLQDQATISPAKCHFQIDKCLSWELVESHCKVHIYRILQEIFQNINKHAHAKNVVLSITTVKSSILIEVSDDGKGFSGNHKPGLGLSNIKTRVATIGGKIEIKSEENIGTNINVQLPIKKSG